MPIPAATAPPNLPPQWWCSIAQCIAHRASTPEARWPQINPQGRCLGPPDTALLHVCGPPRPGVANRPSSGACCVGLGQGQRGAHRRGSRGQRRVPYQRTRLIKPRSASHGKAAAMRARIAGPSITHSSNKAWRTGDFGPSNVALLVGQWVLPGGQNSVRRGRKPREKSKIDQTLRSGSFEFDLCQKSRGSSPKRTNSIPASRV